MNQIMIREIVKFKNQLNRIELELVFLEQKSMKAIKHR